MLINDPFITVLFLAGVGILVALFGVTGLLVRRTSRWQGLLTAGVVASSALVSLLLSSGERIWALAPIAVALLVRAVTAEVVAMGLVRRRRSLAWSAIVVTGGMLVGVSAIRLEELAPSEAWDAVDLPLNVDLHPAGANAYTDAGQAVPLMLNAIELPTDDTSSAPETQFLATTGFQFRLIRLSEADMSYNCHGWTFAQAKYWIRGGNVPQILADNGYHPVETPRVGDVAVYFAPDGGVAHTGLVRTLLSDGVVLVESKWGQLGRFLHPSDSTPYRGKCVFHRSERVGHDLRGIGSTLTAAAESANGR